MGGDKGRKNIVRRSRGDEMIRERGEEDMIKGEKGREKKRARIMEKRRRKNVMVKGKSRQEERVEA